MLVAPAQHQPEFVVLAGRHVREVHDRGHDLPGDQGVVEIERAENARPQTPFCGVRERHRRRPGGSGKHAPQRPGDRHALINSRRSRKRITPFG
jgi:hypothetical protein